MLQLLLLPGALCCCRQAFDLVQLCSSSFQAAAVAVVTTSPPKVPLRLTQAMLALLEAMASLRPLGTLQR